MKKINLLDLIVFLFVVLFVYAATSKILEYELFKAQIGKSPLIMGYAGAIAWMVPAIEIIISFALLIPRFQLIGLFSAFFLMFTFTLYIFFILNFSPYVPCSCGGVLSNMGWTEHLIFNVGFTLLAVAGIFLYNRQRKREQSFSAPITESFNTSKAH